MSERCSCGALRSFADIAPDCPIHAPNPIDWPARFRAAADVAEKAGARNAAEELRYVAYFRPHVLAVIGRALSGETS